jgi:N-acetylmuramoyl-L-alanine amidase
LQIHSTLLLTGSTIGCRNVFTRIRGTILIFLLCLIFNDVIAQEVLPRISVATRSDGLGYVIRYHFTAAPDSFKVFQPSADLIQLAIYKNGVDVNRISVPAGGDVIRSFSFQDFGLGFGTDIRLASSSNYLARAYLDANQRHLLLGLTRISARDIGILTDGQSVINWSAIKNRYDAGRESFRIENLAETGEIHSEHPDSNIIVPELADSFFLPPIVPSINTERRRLRTVVLDAGHGGRDPGAIGPTRVMEKNIALAVAKKVGEYINQYLPDVNVVYTRDNDTFIGLSERGSIANRAQGDLFVSIHANAARSRQAIGTEVFFLGVARTESALEVMKQENSVISFEDPSTRTRELTEEELILYELTNIGYMSASQRLAEKIDRQFADRAGRRTRGVKQAGFVVLYHASMPAVLVELGFISNPTEERYMNSEQGQAILASAIYRAIRDYKELIEQ